MKNLIQKWNSINLIKRIICGLIVGIILGLAIPQASVISILGDLFVGALRGIAPLLVFFLVMSSLCHMGKGQKTNMKFVVVLYLLGNILTAASAEMGDRHLPYLSDRFPVRQLLSDARRWRYNILRYARART